MTFFFQSYEQGKVSFLKYVFIYFRILVWHVFKCVSLRIILVCFLLHVLSCFLKALKESTSQEELFLKVF